LGVKQYATDLRERLRRAIDAGLSMAEASRRFGVGTTTIKDWRRRRRETGSVAATPRRGRPPRIGAGQSAALAAQVAAHPDATWAEHGAHWAQAHGVGGSVTTMSRLRRKLGLPLKKRRLPPASGTRRRGRRGEPSRPRSTRPPSSSSTRPVPIPR
jgi:transposase